MLSLLGVTYNKVKTEQFSELDLEKYSIIIFANDQTSSTYAYYADIMSQVEEFVSAGGVVVFGACDKGWAGGFIGTALPGGVTKTNYSNSKNYIVDSEHPIITGELIDGVVLVDDDLFSNACSHIVFDESTLPMDTKVILRDSTRNAPTLVEYSIGDGLVIASGLTWEHSYANHINDTFGHYAQIALADLFMYAVSISNSDVSTELAVDLSVNGSDEMLSDEVLDISATVKSASEMQVEDVCLSIVLPDELELTEASAESVLTWEILDVEESKDANWILKLKDDIELTEAEMNVNVEIKLSYTIPETGEVETKDIVQQIKVIRNNKAVVVVPGIMGTNLVKTETNEPVWGAWMGNSMDVLKLHDAFQSLKCDDMGKTWYSIEPQNDYGYDNTYEKIITELEDDEVINEEYDIMFFSYDWRKGVNKVAEELSVFIENYDEVVFVAHSMGGLVTERYIAYYGDDKVSMQITAGTPFWGTPAMMAVLDTGNLGYIIGLPLMAELFTSFELPSILINLGSCYDLLPNEEYATEASWMYENRRVFEKWYDFVWYHEEYFNYIFDEFDKLIANDYNSYLWENGKMDHYQIDISQNNTSDLKRIALVGTGYNTISDIEVVYFSGDNIYVPRYGNGDGVVTLTSATMNDNQNILDIRVFNNVGHMGLIQEKLCTDVILTEIKKNINQDTPVAFMLGYSVEEATDNEEVHNALIHQLAISGEYEFEVKNENSSYAYTYEGVVDGDLFKINPMSVSDLTFTLTQFAEDDLTFAFTSLKEQSTDIALVLNGENYLFQNISVKAGSVLLLDLNMEALELKIDMDGDGAVDTTVVPNLEDTPVVEEPAEVLDITVESRNANVSNTNTINPNITVTNHSEKPIDLRELTISYVFNPDEKENIEFHCDWLAVNHQYIGNVAVCEFVEGNNGNVYATISFDTDVQVNCEEPLMIHFRLNATDWSSWDFTNDYSMGTETTTVTDSIIINYGNCVYGVIPE